MDWQQLSVDHIHARRQQAQQVTQEGLRAQQEHAQVVYAAYQAFGQSEHGRVILQDLTQTFLLQWAKTPEDEGARRLVLRILEMIRTAPEKMQGAG